MSFSPGQLAGALLARRQIAALCVSGRSQYKHMAAVLAFDQRRDARTFAGGIPVVAHPPCRCWSKFLSSQAKPADSTGEMALGLWCVDQVKRHGGVLEHPAHSKLFDAAGLPRPGDFADPFLYTIYVEQSWFGFGMRKATWLLVSGVPHHSLPPFPFRLSGFYLGMTHKAENSRTVLSFANWLCAVSRLTWHSLPVRSYGPELAELCIKSRYLARGPGPLACYHDLKTFRL